MKPIYFSILMLLLAGIFYKLQWGAPFAIVAGIGLSSLGYTVADWLIKKDRNKPLKFKNGNNALHIPYEDQNPDPLMYWYEPD